MSEQSELTPDLIERLKALDDAFENGLWYEGDEALYIVTAHKALPALLAAVEGLEDWEGRTGAFWGAEPHEVKSALESAEAEVERLRASRKAHMIGEAWYHDALTMIRDMKPREDIEAICDRALNESPPALAEEAK